MKVPAHIANLMTMILNSEGYPATWYVTGRKAKVITSAPPWATVEARRIAEVGQ